MVFLSFALAKRFFSLIESTLFREENLECLDINILKLEVTILYLASFLCHSLHVSDFSKMSLN